MTIDNTIDAFAFGGRQDDGELLDAERQICDVLSRWGDGDLPDDAAALVCHQQRDLERRINETVPRTMTGAAIKLRQLLRLLEDCVEWDDDETVSVRQLVAFVEAMIEGDAA